MMPNDSDRKANLDELTVLSKCLAGITSDQEKQLLGEDDGLVKQLRAAISAVLGQLGHGDPGHTVVLTSIDPCVLDNFVRVVAVVDGTVEQDAQWLDSNCAAVRERADYLQDAGVDDDRSRRWIDLAARALVAAHVTRNE